MKSIPELIDVWYERVAVTQIARYLSAAHIGRRKYTLGVPAIMLAAFAGTPGFATLAKQPGFYVQLAIGFSSVAAAVLASLQTFMSHSERAETTGWQELNSEH